MKKTKVVNKEQIEQVLFEGGKIHYSQWDAKASLIDVNGIDLGTIRFETYLQLDLRESALKLPSRLQDGSVNDEASPFCKLRRPDPWCGYDEYQLREAIPVLCKMHKEHNKYYRRRIWR